MHNNILNMRLLAMLFLIFLLDVSCTKDKISVSPPNSFILPDPPQFGQPYNTIPPTGELVFYEVNFRLMSPEGNIKGVISRLDSIQSLGANVIWLMPIHPTGVIHSFGSPYCVRNYRSVSNTLGSLADLRELVKQAHLRGICVLMDWVANHTSWDNPWTANKSWYLQSNGEIISPPGTTWTDVAALNYSNNDMRAAMINVMKYWILDANIDGFRCDAADYIPFDFWKQAIDTLRKIPNRKLIMLAEGRRADHFAAGFNVNFAWDFLSALKQTFSSGDARNLISTSISEINSVPNGCQKLRFTANHDEALPTVTFGGEQGAIAAFVLAVFTGGIPLIYGGQEAGYANESYVDWQANKNLQSTYKTLLAIRKKYNNLIATTPVNYSDANCNILLRTNNVSQLLLIVNVRSSSQVVVLPSSIAGTKWKDAISGNEFTFSNSQILAPYQYMIMEK